MSHNQKLGRSIRILIDTGANRNLIDSTIPFKTEKTTPITIKNTLGTKISESKVKINLLSTKVPPQTFFVTKFHNFFNALIGSQYLARTKAQIDYDKETVTISGTEFCFKKYFPNKRLNFHTVVLQTTIDGDWFVPTYQRISKNAFIEPGLYRSKNKRTVVNIVSNAKEPPKLPKIGLKVNNFETIQPIPSDISHKLSKGDILSLIRTKHLSKLEEMKIIDLVHEHQNILLKQNEKLSATTIIKHKINTTDDNPIYTKSYRYPHSFKADVAEQIQEMISNNIIRPSNSPYNAPIWVVPKKTDASGKKKVRLVIDYRKLNEKTIPDKFPIPQIEEILDNLGRSTYFTTLDLKSGFHQIEMDAKDMGKTAFSADGGHYEFTRMPFGLMNAPATFQRAMNAVLGGLIGKICYVYLDDIIIFGESLEKHLENIKDVFRRLIENNLKIQLDKCEFLKRETEFLGHVVTPEGVKPNPDKVEQIVNWPLPTTQTQIKQFLGLSGYYRRFIKDYSKLVKPLSKYLKKEVALDTKDKDFIEAFETLKKIISTDQVLAYPQFDKPFILTTDASKYAIGAVLSQMQDGVERPIAFASRTLNDTETTYGTTEQEALAIIWAVRKFEPYLYGNKFLLITDHQPLTFIKTSNKNAKLLRWRLELEKFDYDVQYKEGKTNYVADALSRKIESNNNESGDQDTVHSGEESDDYFIHFSDRPINYYRNQIIFRDSNLDTIITENPFQNYRRTIITNNDLSEQQLTNIFRDYHGGRQTAILAPENMLARIQDILRSHFSDRGHFVFVSRMVEDVANEERRNAIIAKEHERAHRGINEVENQIRRSYFFPKMHRLITNYINGCRVCYAHKYDRKPYNIKISPRPITDKPFKRVHMDIFIISGQNFLSLIDSFSKHLQMIPMNTKNLVDVQDALNTYISTFMAPRLIVTDHETTFQSNQLRQFLANFGTQLEYASSSESNGQIEKTHSTIIEIFNTNKHKFRGNDTRTIVKASVALYNDSVHSTTTFKPNEVIFNNNNLRNLNQIHEESERIFSEVIKNSQAKLDDQLKKNETRETPPNINENQEVFIKPNIRTKTQPRGKSATAQEVTLKTFKNGRVKRNKNKIKRLKKRH